MQRVVENEHRMAELHKKISRVEEVCISSSWDRGLHGSTFLLKAMLPASVAKLDFHTYRTGSGGGNRETREERLSWFRRKGQKAGCTTTLR